MVNAWFLRLGACDLTLLWPSFVHCRGEGRGCGDRAGGRAAHRGGSVSQLPGEGYEHGTLNQQNYLPCLGQETLSCLSQHPHCPHSSSLWLDQEQIQTQTTGRVLRGLDNLLASPPSQDIKHQPTQC